MKIHIEVDTDTLRKLVLDYLHEKLTGIEFTEQDVQIQVQSKQNYRVHEWENGLFRAIVDKG